MGRHAKTRRRQARWASHISVAGAAGLAASGIAMGAVTPPAAAAVPAAPGTHRVVVDAFRTAAAPAGADSTPAAFRTAVARARLAAVAVAPAHHTVRAGESLSEIAARDYGSASLWPALWWVNKSAVRNPNVITTGQVLKLSGWHPRLGWLDRAAAHAIPAPPPVHAAAVIAAATVAVAAVPSGRHAARHADPYDGQHGLCGDGDGDGMDMPCSLLHRAGSSPAAASYVPRHRAAAVTASAGGYSGNIGTSSGPGGSFGACVVARESGGNSQVMNSSGHYGLYQFSESTWVAYGGSSATFGHASVAEQERVFSNALARGGESNWSPYDGC